MNWYRSAARLTHTDIHGAGRRTPLSVASTILGGVLPEWKLVCVSYVEVAVIDSILNLLFRCAHPRLTRPFSPVSLHGASQGGAYVVCLDCGKQFAYDLTEMKIGRSIDRSHEAAVVPSNLPMP